MSQDRPFKDEPHGVPPVMVSSQSTRVNRTGSWKYIRPVYKDKTAPCNQGCPVGIDIEGHMNLLREGRVDEAVELLLSENPLPAVTGRVCYHPCETACNRQHFDGAVSIHAVERILGDRALEEMTVRPRGPRQPEKVAVVGSGPAGLACSYHLARMGYPVTVYESDPEPGGILRYGIPEYRLPKAVLAREVDRIRRMGVEFHCGVRVGTDVPWSALEEHDAVFLATGASRGRSLGASFEGAPGVSPGFQFLKDVSSGQRPELPETVVVVGGGNTAIDCARTAVRLGARRTVILYRRTRDEMPANSEEIDAALAEGVEIEFLLAPVSPVTEELPDEDPLESIRAMFGSYEMEPPRQKLTGLTCVRMKLGEPDESGRRRPEPVPGGEFVLPADMILTALGEDVDFASLPRGVRHDGHRVASDSLGGTHLRMFFAGGDMVEDAHTVAWALGSGKRAALGIDHFLKSGSPAAGNGSSPEGPDLPRFGATGNVSLSRWAAGPEAPGAVPSDQVVQLDDLNLDHFTTVPRTEDVTFQYGSRTTFTEVNRGIDPEDLLMEATRCINCGVCNGCEICLVFCPDLAIAWSADGKLTIDYDYCKGCGVCSVECPRGAITLTREGL